MKQTNEQSLDGTHDVLHRRCGSFRGREGSHARAEHGYVVDPRTDSLQYNHPALGGRRRDFHHLCDFR